MRTLKNPPWEAHDEAKALRHKKWRRVKLVRDSHTAVSRSPGRAGPRRTPAGSAGLSALPEPPGTSGRRRSRLCSAPAPTRGQRDTRRRRLRPRRRPGSAGRSPPHWPHAGGEGPRAQRSPGPRGARSRLTFRVHSAELRISGCGNRRPRRPARTSTAAATQNPAIVASADRRSADLSPRRRGRGRAAPELRPITRRDPRPRPLPRRMGGGATRQTAETSRPFAGQARAGT